MATNDLITFQGDLDIPAELNLTFRKSDNGNAQPRIIPATEALRIHRLHYGGRLTFALLKYDEPLIAYKHIRGNFYKDLIKSPLCQDYDEWGAGIACIDEGDWDDLTTVLNFYINFSVIQPLQADNIRHSEINLDLYDRLLTRYKHDKHDDHLKCSLFNLIFSSIRCTTDHQQQHCHRIKFCLNNPPPQYIKDMMIKPLLNSTWRGYFHHFSDFDSYLIDKCWQSILHNSVIDLDRQHLGYIHNQRPELFSAICGLYGLEVDFTVRPDIQPN